MKAKNYPILKIISSINNLLSNDNDIKVRKINTNKNTSLTANTHFYTIVPLGQWMNFKCPAVCTYSTFDPDYKSDYSSSDIIVPNIFIDVCSQNTDLPTAISESYMLTEDIRAIINKNKGLNGTVAECKVSKIEPLGAVLDDGDPFKFAFKIHLDIKTR